MEPKKPKPEKDPKTGRFLSGNIGGGRPKGSRNQLGEAFTDALYADFQEHGVDVIAKVRAEEPAAYLRVVAGLLPKEVKIENQPLGEMSDDELVRLIDIIRATSASAQSPDQGTAEAPRLQ